MGIIQGGCMGGMHTVEKVLAMGHPQAWGVHNRDVQVRDLQ
jgi:hypothetical protein